jgi:hypothetical protein
LSSKAAVSRAQFEPWAVAAGASLRALDPNGGSQVDLSAVAKGRGVKKVDLASMERDGILLPIKGGFAVKIRSDRSGSDRRRRWTLAHELAHTLFYEAPSASSIPRRTWPRDLDNTIDEEAACNLAAEYLLIPPVVGLENEPQAHPSMVSLRNVSETYGVSLHAAARAIAERGATQLVVIAVRRSEGESNYRVEWTVGPRGLGVFPNMRLHTGSLELARCFSGRAGFASGPLSARIGEIELFVRDAEFASIQAGRRAALLVNYQSDRDIEARRNNPVGDLESQLLLWDDEHVEPQLSLSVGGKVA